MSPAGQRSAGAPANQYQILAHLATGGMAELYLARSVGLAGFERYVVLKRIMAQHARNHRFVAMFLDEARLASQLHHPNIAQVHDIGRVGDSYFFTMEYVHGENVRDLLQRVAGLQRRIPIEHTLAIVAGAAAGLHHAHDKRGFDHRPLEIVHRDVSPSNLMVTYEGGVKLVDFGIAKAAHRLTETRTGAIKGKVAYMSPEQCRGATLDRRSDVFSLGVVLWEMLAMSRLFKRASEYDTMTAIVNGGVPPPSSRQPDLPPELDELTLRALRRRPDERFPSAGELLGAIEAFAAHQQLSLSSIALGRYLRELFGERPEPWYELEIADSGPLTVETTNADLAVPHESDPSHPRSGVRSWRARRTTPLPLNRADTEPVPTVIPPDLSDEARAAPDRPRSWRGELDAAWHGAMTADLPIVDLRPRGRWLPWLVAAALIAAGAGFALIRRRAASAPEPPPPPRPKVIAPVTSPPPPPIAPEPAPLIDAGAVELEPAPDAPVPLDDAAPRRRKLRRARGQ